MNNKKIQYINLLLPNILYFVLFMLEVVMGHGITKALFTVYFIVFIILFFGIRTFALSLATTKLII